METTWFEDFVSLAETHSFSRSAQLRHVTQPAFSRRIQSLEAWAGVDLVDRSVYPTRLTPAGQTLHGQALQVLQQLHATRAMLRAHIGAAQDFIEFAVPHTLAFTFFPAWVSDVHAHFGPIKSRLIALNVHDAVMRLVEGSCDLLIAYHHESQPYQLDTARYEYVSLGHEELAPYSRPDGQGGALHALPGTPARPVPYLAYAPGAYLGKLVERILSASRVPLHLSRVYETDMAEGLKAMAMEGHGVAFLPLSAVRKELQTHKLVRATTPELGSLSLTVDVRAYRERPSLPDARALGRGAVPPPPGAHALWAYLLEHAQP